ncbi:hypothetical protein SLEP1_g13843 [Rubroshorea leprosula]|uniref:Uncharacterized protein n=1 Tax=Rubroshorea leprosula TaxID=152421 RepID=A0AAV5IRN3_9ROSI|nr:hypothetical protein SLEP1_g13843 [Rubroshorea leprosula]
MKSNPIPISSAEGGVWFNGFFTSSMVRKIQLCCYRSMNFTFFHVLLIILGSAMWINDEIYHLHFVSK